MQRSTATRNAFYRACRAVAQKSVGEFFKRASPLAVCPACNGVPATLTPFCGFCGGDGVVPEHALAQYQRHYVLSQDEIELILIEEFSDMCDMGDIQYAANRIMTLLENRKIHL